MASAAIFVLFSKLHLVTGVIKLNKVRPEIELIDNMPSSTNNEITSFIVLQEDAVLLGRSRGFFLYYAKCGGRETSTQKNEPLTAKLARFCLAK